MPQSKVVNIKQVENLITWVLYIGIVLSLLLVMVGGSVFLLQYGTRPLHSEFLMTENVETSALQIWHQALTFSSLGLIQLGLLLLVMVQIVRVALLALFYLMTNDYRFTLISFFILIVLFYSFAGRA